METVKTGLTVKNMLFCGDKKKVKTIYTEAFPKKERMPFWLMLFLSCFPTTKFLVFYDGETPCGLIYMAKIFRQAYILFFAVDEKLRSKGYGGKILGEIRKKYPKCNIVVSIEPCDDDAPDCELRKRRKAFYIRNGYSDSGYDITLSGIRQEILVCGGDFKKFPFSVFLIAYSCFAIIPIIRKRKQEVK